VILTIQLTTQVKSEASIPSSSGAGSHHKMQNQGNDREQQQEVNQPAGYMEDGKATYPCDQQNYKKYRPNAHSVLRATLSVQHQSDEAQTTGVAAWSLFTETK
jgi:hypothetical protein